MKNKAWAYLLLFPAFVWLSKIILETRYADNDLFARVAVGRLIELNGVVSEHDVFSFLPVKERWYDHEWLSGWLFYKVSQIGAGDAALLICNLLFLVATGLALFAAQSGEVRNPVLRIVWLFLLLIISLSVWVKVIRARVFTFLCLALLFWVFRQWREGKLRWLPAVLLPLVFTVWINAHGGFVVGWGLFGVFAVLSVFDKRLPTVPVLVGFVASVLAGLINPYGPKYLLFVFEAVTKDRGLITEWAPLPLFSVELFSSGHGVVVLLIGVLIVGMWRMGRALPIEALLFLLLTFVAGVRSQRLMPMFYLTAAVYGVDCFAAVLQPTKRLQRLFKPDALWGATKLLTVAACCWAVVVFWQSVQRLSEVRLNYNNFPVSAMAWLNANREGGNILAPFNQASYVLWRGYPKFRVAIDGRYEEVYPDSTIELALAAQHPSFPNHREALATVAPDYIMLWNTDPVPFAQHWHTIYRDSTTIILSQTPATASTSPVSPDPIWPPTF